MIMAMTGFSSFFQAILDECFDSLFTAAVIAAIDSDAAGRQGIDHTLAHTAADHRINTFVFEKRCQLMMAVSFS